MLNNSFGLLEELIADGDADRALDNRAEDFQVPPEGNGHLPIGGGLGSGHAEAEYAYKQSRVDSLLWAYRDVGYLYADLNPLGESYSEEFTSLSQVKAKSYHTLRLEEFGLSEADLGLEFFAGGGLKRRMRLSAILEAFRAAYCGYMGVEFLHIQNRDMREWLIQRL